MSPPCSDEGRIGEVDTVQSIYLNVLLGRSLVGPVMNIRPLLAPMLFTAAVLGRNCERGVVIDIEKERDRDRER